MAKILWHSMTKFPEAKAPIFERARWVCAELGDRYHSLTDFGENLDIGAQMIEVKSYRVRTDDKMRHSRTQQLLDLSVAMLICLDVKKGGLKKVSA